MTTRDRVVLERLKARVAARLPLSRIVLFGSRARDDNEPESDMDVLVVLNGPVTDEAEEYVRFCAWELGFENGLVVVPLVVERQEWEEGLTSASLLALAVGREGVEV